MSLFNFRRSRPALPQGKPPEIAQREYNDLFASVRGGTTSPRGDVAAPQTRDVTVSPGARRMYQAAQTNRLTQDWIVSVTSANAEALVSRKAVISRARQLERDNSLMERILAIHENNVVGHRGIRLQMKIQDPNGQPDTVASKLILNAWAKAGRKEYCTVRKDLTRIEVQNLAIRAFVRDGGILFRKRRGAGINDFSFALDPIEIDRLDHDLNRPQAGTDNEIQFGIEMDQFKAPLYFHILTRHPGDVFAYRRGPKYRERVPADEIIFLWSPKRAEETVGMPTVSSVMPRMNMLDKYEQAEAVAAFIASCKGGFFTKNNPDAKYEGDGEDEGGNTITQMEPGMIEELPPYMDYKPNDPQHPTDAYAQFTKDQRRGIASGAGVTYNDLANDLEGVNYSSIRAGVLEVREGYKKLQTMMVEKLMVDWFESWLPFAILSGQIPLPIAKLQKWMDGAYWKPRRWPWVDPLKDVQADILAIQNKLTSRTAVISEDEDGAEPGELWQEIEDETTLAESHGIDLNPPLPGAQQPAKQDPKEDDDPPAE